MRSAAICGLLATLSSATSVLADTLHAAPAATITSAPAATPSPELVDSETNAHIEIRQNNVVNPAATINPDQVDAITTLWFESAIGSSVTYVQVIYTQTFAAIPDQLPSAASGSIGYGTLKRTGGGAEKSKRDDVEARETGLTYAYAQPVVLVLQNVAVTQYVQPVEQVLVLQTVTLTPNGTDGALLPTGNGTLSGNGTLAGNATLANSTSTNTSISITSTIGSFSAAAYNYTPSAATGTGVTTTGFFYFF